MTASEINTTGARRLCSAVIESAIQDLRLMRARGAIRGREALRENVPLANGKMNGHQLHHSGCRYLIHFFRKGGVAEQWIEMAGFDIDADEMRKELGL